MRVLFVTPYYWPELFRITDVAAGLKARGHHVEVLTGLPNYPTGRFFKGYGLLGPYSQEHDGVRITRVPVMPRGTGSAIHLVLTYLSFAATSALRALTLGRRRWDVVFVFQVSPVTSIFPAAVIRALFRTPVVAWVQDLWPEVLLSTGLARSPVVLGVARALSGWLYRRCDRILATSRSFVPRLEALGVRPLRIGYLPQWAEDVFANEPAEGMLPNEIWPPGFAVVFAGNMGRVQALDTILDAAEVLRDEPELRWVLLGDGSRSEWVAGEVERRGLHRNVFLMGRRPLAHMPAFYAKAGAMLVSLIPDEAMALTVPAKLQSYLAAGRPVIGSIDGETARIIDESGSGYSVPAGDARALANTVIRMKGLSPAERAEMGRRGQAYCAEHFSREGCLDTLERALEEVVGASAR